MLRWICTSFGAFSLSLSLFLSHSLSWAVVSDRLGMAGVFPSNRIVPCVKQHKTYKQLVGFCTAEKQKQAPSAYTGMHFIDIVVFFLAFLVLLRWVYVYTLMFREWICLPFPPSEDLYSVGVDMHILSILLSMFPEDYIMLSKVAATFS